MDILIKNATVVVGDGKTILESALVWIDKGRIAGIEQGNDKIPGEPDVSEIIDATGTFVLPGLLNAHSHCCSMGPKFSSAALPPDLGEVMGNIDRHMLQGTTTLLNLSGFGTMEETEVVNKNHPARILTGTCHFPSCIRAAKMVDGAGLRKEHLAFVAEDMLKLGAVAIGEIGSGATLGGGVTDYKYIPEEIKRRTGVTVSAQQANQLKTLFLQKGKKPAGILAEIGLEGKLSIEQARQIIIEIALKPVETALDGFDEACALGAVTGTPVLCHTALPSVQKIIKLLEDSADTSLVLLAGHCNHPSFTIEEAVKFAGMIKERGGIVDVSSLDSIVTQWMNFPERIEALVSAGVVDTFSTDYGGGHWDSVLEMIHYLNRKQIITIPQGVAMATGNVAKIFGEITTDLGLIATNKAADLLIADQKNISRIFKVIINGVAVADKGGRLP